MKMRYIGNLTILSDGKGSQDRQDLDTDGLIDLLGDMLSWKPETRPTKMTVVTLIVLFLLTRGRLPRHITTELLVLTRDVEYI